MPLFGLLGIGGCAHLASFLYPEEALGMPIEKHVLPVEQGNLPLTVARGNGSRVSRASVVIVPSAFGVAADLETQMEELARDAGLVVSFDPFFRDDPGPALYGDRERVMKRLQSLNRERAGRDFNAVIDWMHTEQPKGSSIIAIGICFGGPLVLQAATEHRVDAVVTWHGSRMENFLANVDKIRCPVRHHFGNLDPIAPKEAIDAIRNAFATHSDTRIVVHEDATHGFSHPTAPVYNERAERAAMADVRKLIRTM